MGLNSSISNKRQKVVGEYTGIEMLAKSIVDQTVGYSFKAWRFDVETSFEGFGVIKCKTYRRETKNVYYFDQINKVSDLWDKLCPINVSHSHLIDPDRNMTKNQNAKEEIWRRLLKNGFSQCNSLRRVWRLRLSKIEIY